MSMLAGILGVFAALIIGPGSTLTLVAGLLLLRTAWQGARSFNPPKSPA